MKSKIKFLALLLALSFTLAINPKQISAQQDYVSFQVFYDALAPFGEWVDYENYGYAWIPDAGADFVPYSTAGYWLFTDYGWTWVSDYEWGWAPFHYGRWDFNNYYGWLWIPDNEWGPSWVNWRRADGYYGWSPMEPGLSLSISFGRPYDSRHDHWMFVREKDFERHDLNRYSVNHSENPVIIRNSTVINNTYIDSRHTTYVAGPLREDVQKVAGRRINPVAIEENKRPGKDFNNGDLRIYRPRVEKSIVNQPKPAPARITNIRDVKPPSERNGSNQPGNVRPQNRNIVLPEQQRTINPAKTIERQQRPNNEKQQNGGTRTQRSQQPETAIPAGNSVRSKQPAATSPVNNNSREKKAQPQIQVPPNNSGSVQQPPYTRPSNTNTVQPRNSNNGRVQQPNTVRPQNNSNQVQPAQQRSSEPARVQQPSVPRQQNTNISRPVRTSPPANDRKQQQNSAKPQNTRSNEQPKESRQERDK